MVDVDTTKDQFGKPAASPARRLMPLDAVHDVNVLTPIVDSPPVCNQRIVASLIPRVTGPSTYAVLLLSGSLYVKDKNGRQLKAGIITRCNDGTKEYHSVLVTPGAPADGSPAASGRTGSPVPRLDLEPGGTTRPPVHAHLHGHPTPPPVPCGHGPGGLRPDLDAPEHPRCRGVHLLAGARCQQRHPFVVAEMQSRLLRSSWTPAPRPSPGGIVDQLPDRRTVPPPDRPSP